MAENNNSYVLEMLRYKRVVSNLTINELGRLLRVSPDFLREMERGNKMPSDYLIYNLADFFGISQDILFNGFNKTPIFGDYYDKIKDRRKFKERIDEVTKSNISEDSRQLLYDNIFEAYLRREVLSLRQ
jgi:transcriptional regulator with XRE-family HTH domain